MFTQTFFKILLTIYGISCSLVRIQPTFHKLYNTMSQTVLKNGLSMPCNNTEYSYETLYSILITA